MYDILREKMEEIIRKNNVADRHVKVVAKPLSPEEAIGNPEHDDYPLLIGKERLMQAEYEGARGVAFTDMFGNYEASLYKILKMDLTNNFRRAIFISTINAVLRYLGLIEGSEHCKDSGPVDCKKKINQFIKERYGNPKIFQVGFQPRLAEALNSEFEFRVTDMDKDNIGKIKQGIKIASPAEAEKFIAWCDLIFATGTSFVNDTARQFLGRGKPIVFYGATCAGVTYLLDLVRYCPEGR